MNARPAKHPDAAPLQALLSPSQYCDPSRFEQERARIFARNWMFAGMAGEVGAPDDYFLVDLAGTEVIVCNGGGRLRAFVNACSHRHARIHDAPCGSRKLVCPYHGWCYDDEGVPSGIPRPENFPQVRADPARFRLRQVELACAGAFIFLRAAAGGPSLQAFLGEAWDFLHQVSAGLDRRIDRFQGTLQANWKVVIENALEGYHVPMVHRETLAAIRQLSAAADDIVDHIPEAGGHSSMTNRADSGWLQKWKRIEPRLGDWPFRFEHYVHQLVFPLLTVTSFMGYSFHIQRFHADAVGRTTVDSSIYSARCSGRSEEGARAMATILDEGVAFTHAVFAEDQRICEQVYRGLHDARAPAVLAGHLEKRIAHFQRAYLGALEAEH